MDVFVVSERIEGLPVRNGEVTRRRGGGMLVTPLGTPPQLFLIGQCGQAVHGHDIRWQRELASVGAHWQQGPHTVQSTVAENLGGAAATAQRLGDALDFVDGAGGQVTDEQQLYDRPGRSADGLVRRRTAGRRGWRSEDSGVEQTTCA
ncbi:MULTISPECIES: hypothetical protein [Streptomyces]|uniref:hypothetical protein n=1 Tax=Streptomyces TaxID=1883 RepID=UPI00240D7656|nr:MULTISPECIES: hypothetical protein [Streptomyces]WFB89089.1 hypothetical protein MMU79_34240 [Streptomyces olivaceus]WGK51439.1 hypothetical protein M6G09_19350 [Streptomyces sp. B146]